MGHVTWPIHGNFDVTFTVGHHLLKFTLDVVIIPGGGFGDFGPGGRSGISARLLRGGGGGKNVSAHAHSQGGGFGFAWGLLSGVGKACCDWEWHHHVYICSQIGFGGAR